ncbi:MAG: ferrochelatase [Simkaniaceae bacterium]|nr:ferrochelatase [Simkaniaceae bacterium]
MKTGVLLINLGTPVSFKPRDVKRYLKEFLLDKRVIDIPWIYRQLLVRGVIVPKKYKESAKNYSLIWTGVGSPLLYYGNRVAKALSLSLGNRFQVELGMRYQEPSIKRAMKKLKSCKKIVVIPLFPQYADATTGSILGKVFDVLKSWRYIPEISILDQFATHPSYIHALAEKARRYQFSDYDHILFSFHGLPKRHLIKSDQNHCCFVQTNCCEKISWKNARCYSAQCHANANKIIEKFNIPKEHYTICFQSKLGKDPWIEPSTENTLQTLRRKGCQKILVFCPSFVADCIETIHEIGIEYKEAFLKDGGISLDFVESLNEDPLWIEALATMVHEQTNAHITGT